MKVNTFITVAASGFLGTPSTRAEVLAVYANTADVTADGEIFPVYLTPIANGEYEICEVPF